MLRKKTLMFTLLLLVLSAFNVALAENSQAIDAAHHAVREAVRAKFGSNYRVAFEKTSESFLSFSEVVISGSAHVSSRDDWDYDRSFRYTVKVKNDGSRARDLDINYSDGGRYRGDSDWRDTNYADHQVRIVAPGWNERCQSSRVRVEGYSRASVTITIYDRRNRVISEGTAKSSNGRFSRTFDLPEGPMRAIVQPDRGSYSDEVRFTVAEGSRDWRPEINIFEPEKDARLEGPRVTLSGLSSDDSVRVQIWDDRGRSVYDARLNTERRRWGTSVRLDDGRYQMQVDSGRYRETREFRVGRGRPPYDRDRESLRFSEPSEGATLTYSRITIAGYSRSNSVHLQVLDTDGRKVINRDVSTRNRYWETQVTLKNGSYRIEVTDDSDRRGIYRNIRVRDRDEGGSSSVLSIQQPRRDSLVYGPRVVVSGTSDEKTVRVQIWDSNDKRVFDEDVATNTYGEWRVTARLDSGRHRIRVENKRSRESREFNFRVD